MRRLREAHTEHRLSPRQFHLLGLLSDRGAMAQGQIGTIMEVDPSILVTLLNPLETEGYISRERDPADRRRHVVSITEAGGRQLAEAAEGQQKAEDDLFAGLDDRQREKLRLLLVALRDALTAP